MPKAMTVNDAEAMLDRIALGRDDYFRVPTNGKHMQAGGEAAMVQAHLTWARDRKENQLKTYVIDELDADEQIRSLSRQFFGISAILMSDDIRDRADRPITTQVRTAGINRLKVLQSERPREASRGPQYEIVCADHLGVGEPRLLYDLDDQGQPTLKGLTSFEFIAEQIAATIMPKRLSRDIDKGFISALGGTLYELFRNTEEHARVDDHRVRLRRSLRSIQARLHSLDPERLGSIVANSPPLASFVKGIRPPRTGAKQIHLVEISVLDSGPGLASAFTGKPLSELSLEDEKAAVINCFAKHATRKTSSTAGLGLPNVIDILREHGGFLRIRTGRQALFADLLKEAERGYGQPPTLLPWFEGNRDPSFAAGTLMTFLLPLSR